MSSLLTIYFICNILCFIVQVIADVKGGEVTVNDLLGYIVMLFFGSIIVGCLYFLEELSKSQKKKVIWSNNEQHNPTKSTQQ